MKKWIHFWGGKDYGLRQTLRRSVVSVGIGAVNMMASLGFVVISKRLVDTVTGVATYSVSEGIAALCVLMVVRLFSSVLYGYFEGSNEAKTLMRLRSCFFDRLMRLRWDGTDRFHSGDAVNRVEEDVRTVVDFVAVKVPGFVLAGLQLLFASVLVFMMSPMMLFLLVAFMVMAAVLAYVLYRPVRRLTRKIRQQDGRVQSHLQESIRNRIIVRVLFGVKRMTERLDQLQGIQYADMMSRLNYSSFAQLCLRLGFLSGYTFAFIYGVLGIKEGYFTFGMMTALLQLVGQVQSPLVGLVKLFPSAMRFMASEERLVEITECEEEKDTPHKLVKNPPEICVDKVSFAYPGQQQRTLDGFSAVFPAGEMSVVMGETGVGKTTLVRLMLALLEPLEGRITLGGVPVGSDTRCNFMYVPQNNTLFSGTIRDNFLLVKPTATDDEMREALHVAVADFVFDLPKGLDALCYEDGNGISGGQARRISIACALLHDGSVFILDEATASLDNETELLLLDNLKQYCKGKKTLIFISHSESVNRLADHVVEMGRRRKDISANPTLA